MRMNFRVILYLKGAISLFFVLICLKFAPCAKMLDFFFPKWYGGCGEYGDDLKGGAINLKGTYERNKKNFNIGCGTFEFV